MKKRSRSSGGGEKKKRRGLLGRVLGRDKWEKMAGLGSEVLKEPLSLPPHFVAASAAIRHKHKWKPTGATLEAGRLQLAADPGVVDLGLAVVHFERSHRKTFLQVKHGPCLRLKFSKEEDWESWLTNLFLHRLYAQSNFLHCPGPSPSSQSGALPSTTSKADPDGTLNGNIALLSIASKIKDAKRIYMDLHTAAPSKPETKSWFPWTRTKKGGEGIDEAKALFESMEAILKDLDQQSRALQSLQQRAGAVVDVGRLRSTSSDVQVQERTSAIPCGGSSGGGSSSSGSSSSSSSSSEEEVPVVRRVSSIVLPKTEVATQRRLPRDALPAPMPPSQPLGLATILKAVKEGSLPLHLFEPLGTLQRMSEPLEYAELLDKAMAEADAVVRMGLVTGFVVGSYSGSVCRTGKPFNPLLGETFALERWDTCGWRYYSEQVMHSPDVSAYFGEGKAGWAIRGVIKAGRPSPSFSYISVQPTGKLGITLGGSVAETYEYQPIETRLQNPASSSPAKRRLEHSGKLTIRASNGLSAVVGFAHGTYSVKGKVAARDGSVRGVLEGKWCESLQLLAPPPAPPRLVFKAGAMPMDAARFYGFSRLARELNEPPNPADAARLPPSDSRLRPDQRAFEGGRLSKAGELKKTLETVQRQRRDKGTSAKPLWFSQPAASSADAMLNWTPNHLYWTKAKDGFKGITFAPIFNLNQTL